MNPGIIDTTVSDLFFVVILDIGYLSIVTCSACGKQINTNQPGEARQHPDLKVLTCKVWMYSFSEK